MADVFMIDTTTDRVGMFTEPNTTGAVEDPNAARNAPLNNPGSNLAANYYNSDYDPMEVATETTVAINHAIIPAGSGTGGVATVNGSRVYGGYSASHVLLNHGLGVVPDFFLIVGGSEVHPGFPVQYDSADGRARCVTAHATTTQIILTEFGVKTSTAMAALTVNYTLLVLRPPPAPTGDVLFEFNPDTGVVRMARDKFKSDRRYLQIVAGGSPFSLPLGRTIDLANGTFRSVTAGTIRDAVPATFRVSFGFDGPSYGPDGNYNGSFAGDPSILVQAP